MAVQVTTVVQTPAQSYDLVDLSTVLEELNVKGSAKDSQVKRYIGAASAAAAQFCNRVFPAETVQDTFDLTFARLQWNGESVLQASRWPINAITSLTENGVALVEDTDYRVDTVAGQIWRLDAESGLKRNWRLTPLVLGYFGGFATIPVDVQDAVIRMIRSRWFARDRDPMAREINIPGVLEQQFWVATGTDAGNMTPDVVDILENYRVPVIG